MNNDLISLEDSKETLCIPRMSNEDAIFYLMTSNEYHHAKGDLPHSAASIAAFNKAIAALKAERPKGKWEFYEEDPNDDDMAYYKCSVCGRLIHAKEVKLLKNYPFCHCGADMRTEDK